MTNRPWARTLAAAWLVVTSGCLAVGLGLGCGYLTARCEASSEGWATMLLFGTGIGSGLVWAAPPLRIVLRMGWPIPHLTVASAVAFGTAMGETVTGRGNFPPQPLALFYGVAMLATLGLANRVVAAIEEEQNDADPEG